MRGFSNKNTKIESTNIVLYFTISSFLELIKVGIATDIKTPIHKTTFIQDKPFAETSGATIVVNTTIPAERLKLIFPVFSDKRDNIPLLFPNRFFNIIILFYIYFYRSIYKPLIFSFC